MKKAIIVFLVILITSVFINAIFLLRPKHNTDQSDQTTTRQNERYVYLAVFTDDPMIINHDMKGMKQFADDYGVNVDIVAPSHFDIDEQLRLLKKTIEEEPDGIMVCGTDISLVPYVNEAVKRGIPTITIDADLPTSDRSAFIGSNWFDIGVQQAEAMVKMVGGKGRVAVVGMGELDNMQAAFLGFRSVMADYKGIIVVGDYNDESNPEKSKQITKDLVQQYDDLVGIAGFDSNSGPGIAAALEEIGLTGKIKVTCVDIAEPHITILKDGAVQKLIGQKRELFTYYGLSLLYELNHSEIQISPDDKKYGIMPIPDQIDTGLIVVDETNVDVLFE